MKAKLLPRSFRLSSIFLLMVVVGSIIWLLTPAPADLLAEKKLLGTWEVRLTETRDATTQTRLVVYSKNDLVGTVRRVSNREFGSSVPKHYWCVRNGLLIDGWQHTTARRVLACFDYSPIKLDTLFPANGRNCLGKLTTKILASPYGIVFDWRGEFNKEFLDPLCKMGPKLGLNVTYTYPDPPRDQPQ